MFRFENLEIWEIAIDYAKDCYFLANGFPDKEKYALSDQLRRAAVSISNNIAEGSAFGTQKFKCFLDISLGSTLETVNILAFAEDLGYITKTKKDELYEKAEKLIRKMRSFKSKLG